jgi:hypothetical protein
MGMFDEIIVPKSYLKSLLDKKDEHLFNTNHTFQTKDMCCAMDVYKVYRQRLYKLEKNSFSGKKEDWTSVNDNVDISFCDSIKDDKGDVWWSEFEFTFKKGRIDTKSKIRLNITETKKDRSEIDRMWDTEQEILDTYRNSSAKYKLFSFLEKCFQKATNWARKKHSIPLPIRREAYEKSGRLKKDPDCLNVYKDV